MLPEKIFSMIVSQLTPLNGAFFLLVGFVSLFFNLADAKRKNHPRAATVACIGGWLYVSVGLALVAKRLF